MKKILPLFILILIFSSLLIYAYLYTYITIIKSNTTKEHLGSTIAKKCRIEPSTGKADCEVATPRPANIDASTTLVDINPKKASVGQKVILKGKNFDASDNTVRMGIGYIYETTLVGNSTLEFYIPDGYDLCPPKQEMCPGGYPKLHTDTQNVSVINSNGESNALQIDII